MPRRNAWTVAWKHTARSYPATHRKRLICEFEAADAERVRESYRSAGVPFERCWTADVYS